jgi:hypothetical protein
MRATWWACGRSGTVRRTIALGALAVAAACAPADLVDPTYASPPETATRAGALAAYKGALAQFRDVFGHEYVATSGALVDELLDGRSLGAPGIFGVPTVDGRVMPEYTDPSLETELGAGDYRATYSGLQHVRGQASEALGMLREFAQHDSPALQGHLYALRGYAELMLAEFFCSGIPLSTLDYGGGYTLQPGSSTADVMRHAEALFDTALTLSEDSVRFMNLARIGRGRALLGLGDVAAAAAAVAEVPDGYRYEVSFSGASGGNHVNFAYGPLWAYSVSDGEGGNGLPFRTSGDPRTPVTEFGPNTYGAMRYYPANLSMAGDGPIVLADWVEARLIEAEAALQADAPSIWLDKLNHLRQTAIVPALPDTTDPGPDGRVDLLFRERGFWLFLTGHRQGDLRRLIRQYGRNAEQVYPTGPYPAGGAFYGHDVTAPIPAEERATNSRFTGCAGRAA